jgi:hypothetical protein
MKYLIESFYQSITGDAPLPVPYREILLTATIMDSIFEQLSGARAAAGGGADSRSTLGLSSVGLTR